MIWGSMRAMRTRTDSAAARVRSRVLSSPERFWRPTDFEGPPGAVDAALSRLAREDELHRVRRGLYWRGRKTLLGMAPPPPESVARELAGPYGVGPAGTNAASALGMSTQLPARAVIAVPSRPPSGTPSIRFVDRSGRYGRVRARLRPTEVALLEVLEDPNRFTELTWDDLTKRMRDLIDVGKLDPTRLSKAALTEPARIRERLRALFRNVGRTSAADAIPARRMPRQREESAAVA
jgi:Family of unknown function (DUF6088)